MLGYTRVMFSDLCRLCATNQSGERIDIFNEHGKKLQLQAKIESLLPTKITESDHLPKVICGKCLLSLENFYAFRNVCIASESMLSSCCEKAPIAEDFLQTGKVYIKNTPAKQIGGKKFVVLTRNKSDKTIPVKSLQLAKPSATTRTATTQQDAVTSTTTPTTNSCVIVDGIKMYRCKTCEKSFKRREHLYQHSKLHTGARPYACDYCYKAFVRKEHLERHVTSHTGMKNYQCEVCTKTFSRKDNLLKHKKTHCRPNAHKCLLCDTKFMLKDAYIAHTIRNNCTQSTK